MRRLRASHPGLSSPASGLGSAFQAYCASISEDRSEREAACLNHATPHDAIHCSIRTGPGVGVSFPPREEMPCAERPLGNASERR
jgi:hypothetical protein